MNKKDLRERLEDVYFEGFVNDWLDEKGWLNDHVYDTREYLARLNKAEEALYGTTLSPEESAAKMPFKKARKRWEEMKKSPLYEALK